MARRPRHRSLRHWANRCDIEQALARLEAEGYVLRGHFSPGATDLQWCERHLLARIHRYTVKRLRREIEPVSLQDFMRFLFDWQHLAPDERLRGPQAVAEVLGQLQGSQRRRRLGGGAAASAHQGLQPALARRCLPQRPVCLEPAGGNSGEQHPDQYPTVLPRDQLNTWRSLAPAPAVDALGLRAQRVHEALKTTVRCSSMNWRRRHTCCPANWKLRCRSWWARAWSARTVSPACAA
jgi:ATP-dependent Lhr-like helicase